MRKTCINEIYKLALQNENVLFFGSDISAGGTEEFEREIPERFFMEGISEGHLIGMMAGLAMNGKIPYLNTIGTFITRRCYEQILLDAGLHRQPIRLIGSGGGTVYAPLGPTHLAMEDIAILRVIPNMTIVVPCDAEEMKRLIPKTLDYPGPIYIRLSKGGDPIVSNPNEPFQIGKATVMRDGEDVLLVSTGITTHLALQSAEELEAKGVSTSVLHIHTLKPLDKETLKTYITNSRVVVTIEEHYRTGGLGSAVAEIFAEMDYTKPKRFYRIGFPDRFLEEYGSQKTLMAHAGVTTEKTVERVFYLLNK